MAKQRPYLKLRGNRWWFQIAVPTDCRATVGSTLKAENLRTSDVAVAQARALERAAFWKNRFIAIRGGAGELPADAFAQGKEWANAEIERVRRQIADPADQAERESLIYDLELGRELEVQGLADPSELRDEDLPPLRRARLLGVKAAVQGAKDTPPEFQEPFSRSAAAYIKDRQRPGSSERLTAQTIAQMEAVYRLYRDHTSDAPLRLTTRRTASQFFDKVKRLDAHWGRSKKTKQRSLDDLLAMADQNEEATTLSDRTLFRYMIALSQVWEWCKLRDETDGDNPFSGQVKKGKSKPDANAPWPDDAIKAYFAAHPDRSKKGKPDPYYWLPRIGYLSGMRLNEICSLTAADIVKWDGVWCFDIKKGKTQAATRAVPIHSALMPIIKLAPKEGYLFAELVPGGRDQKRSAQIGKQLGRAFKTIPGGSTFHAFRKNATGFFERGRVRESEAAQILGHGKSNVTYGVYSPHGIQIALRQEIVELIRLPEGA